jgi:hypothetical protein
MVGVSMVFNFLGDVEPARRAGLTLRTLLPLGSAGILTIALHSSMLAFSGPRVFLANDQMAAFEWYARWR